MRSCVYVRNRRPSIYARSVNARLPSEARGTYGCLSSHTRSVYLGTCGRSSHLTSGPGRRGANLTTSTTAAAYSYAAASTTAAANSYAATATTAAARADTAASAPSTTTAITSTTALALTQRRIGSNDY